MGNYDSLIQVPTGGQNISSSLFGKPVRDAIIDLDRRVSNIESTLSNYAFKTSTTTRVSTTTLADDPDLKLFLQANSTYFVEFFLSVAAVPAEDVKTGWSVPAGVSGTKRVFGPGSAALQTDADNIAVRAGTHQFGTTMIYNGVRSSLGLQFRVDEVAIVKTTTAGFVAMQWAQGTSGTTGSTVNNDSFVRATLVG